MNSQMQTETSRPFKRVVFDIESNGLLDNISKIHCIVLRCLDTGEFYLGSSFGNPGIESSLDILTKAELIIGHNIIGYDIPAIQKIFPKWKTQAVVRDTLILAQLLIPSDKLRDNDFKADKIPVHLRGRFSLEAFGYRLGNYKGDFKGPWDTLTQEMLDYCRTDVHVTHDLWNRLAEISIEWGLDPYDPNPPAGKDAIQMEQTVAEIVARQERYGFCFDVKAARDLHIKLAGRQSDLEAELQKIFPPKVHRTPFTPKANNSKLGYVKGKTITREVVIPFNPGSRKQVAERLVALGWKPTEFGNDGVPSLDDDTLTALPYPEAKILAEYFLIQKRLGQLSNGKEALIRNERKGRIHGRVITNGAVTGRMTHSKPNMNLPKVGSLYGEEFRSLMIASPGKVLVGCDADSLEARCLAHYMARYDDGAYEEAALRGDKNLGTDNHSVNARALGLDPKKHYAGVNATGRDIAKTWFSMGTSTSDRG